MKTVKLLTEQSLSTKSKVDIWKGDWILEGWDGVAREERVGRSVPSMTELRALTSGHILLTLC